MTLDGAKISLQDYVVLFSKYKGLKPVADITTETDDGCFFFFCTCQKKFRIDFWGGGNKREIPLEEEQ